MMSREYRIVRQADGTVGHPGTFTSHSAALAHCPWGCVIQRREVSEWSDMPTTEAAVTRIRGRKAPQDVAELFERGRKIKERLADATKLLDAAEEYEREYEQERRRK
jgi:hypothetical protein